MHKSMQKLTRTKKQKMTQKSGMRVPGGCPESQALVPKTPRDPPRDTFRSDFRSVGWIYARLPPVGGKRIKWTPTRRPAGRVGGYFMVLKYLVNDFEMCF